MYLEERPYEKCRRFGPENLTDAELLAVILRTGTQGENSLDLARRILHPGSGSSGLLSLHRWSGEQLMRIRGIGRVKSIQILCIADLPGGCRVRLRPKGWISLRLQRSQDTTWKIAPPGQGSAESTFS